MRDDYFMHALAQELDDLKRDLMEMSRGLVQPHALDYSYKPGVSELAEVLKWQWNYADGTASYETGCNLLRDGGDLYWSFVNAREVSRLLRRAK